MSMRTLITGSSGFTAPSLIELLSGDPGTQLALTDRTGGSARTIISDLADSQAVNGLISRARPDRVYHLAGSFTGDYETDYRSNVLCTKNLLDAVSTLHSGCRVLLVGSAAEYGLIDVGGNPVAETHPLKPVTIRGLTKVYQTLLMEFYCRTTSLDLVMARTFNLYGDGHRMSEHLFVGGVQRQIERFKRNEATNIVVGNLDARRDYLDVRDAVRHYRTIMERGKTGEVYNVGSGRSIRMEDLLAQLLSAAGVPMSVVRRRDRAPHESDVPEIYADLTKLHAL